FNINAYGDDGFVRTTLLEGSVQVSQGGKPLRISPGSDAVSGADSVSAVESDAEKVMGWRNGNFVFRATPMKEVLKQIERWYNVDIINQGGNNNHLNATFPRTVALSRLLAYLEGTGAIQFKWGKGNLIVE
ncbi:MAG: FecR family protein, partial [Flavisolibacter sp.]